MLGAVTVIVVRTGTGDDVHRIFRSLNSTGVPLRQADQIRVHTFMRLPDAYARYWEPLEARLTPAQIEHLFWLDLAGDHPEAAPDDTVRLQQQRLDAHPIDAELARITRLADLYLLMIDPATEPHSEVRLHLTRLEQWDSDNPDALVLELLRLRDVGAATDDELASALHVVESFLVRRLLVNRLPHNLSRLFREAVRGIEGAGSVDKRVLRWFSTGRRHFITDEEVRRNLDAFRRPLPQSWFDAAVPGIDDLDAVLSAWPGPVATTGIGDQLRQILHALPAGRWTSHRDLADAVGASTQAVVNAITVEPPLNLHRILRDRGDAHPDKPNQKVLLEKEGVIFDEAGYADPGTRMPVAELVSCVVNSCQVPG